MGIRSLTARNISRYSDIQGSGRDTAGANTPNTNALSRITPNLVAILQQNRMIAKNTAVLPGMARDMSVMRQGITKLAKVQDIKSTVGADSFNAEARGLEESYEARMASGKRPTRAGTSGRSGLNLKDESKGFFNTLIDLFKTGISTLFSNKGILATGILAALFPKESIDIMEGLLSGMRILGVMVLKVANAFAKFALFMHDTFGFGPGDTLAAAAGVWAGKGVATAVGVATYKTVKDKLSGLGTGKTSTGVDVDLDADKHKARANDIFKKPFKERVVYWVKNSKVFARLAGVALIKRLSMATVASASGVGAFAGALIAAAASSYTVFQIISAFMDWDEPGAAGVDGKEVEEARKQIEKKGKKEEDEEYAWRTSLVAAIESTDRASTTLSTMTVNLDPVRKIAGVPLRHEKTDGGSPTPDTAPTPAPSTSAPASPGTKPTSIKTADYVRERLKKELKIDDMDANAIIANLMQESGLKPNAVSKEDKNGRTAVGIAQWRGPRKRAFYKFVGLTDEKISEINTAQEDKQALNSIPIEKQVDFMIAELQNKIDYGGGGHKHVLGSMKKAITLKDKITAFEAGYEGSGTGKGSSYVGHSMNKRYQYGADVSNTNVGNFSPNTNAAIPMMDAPTQIVNVKIDNSTNNAAQPTKEPIPAILTGISDSDFMVHLQKRAGTPNLAY